eukprot:scaffold90883_cov30-Tisochrysis_lutea.AAC.3
MSHRGAPGRQRSDSRAATPLHMCAPPVPSRSRLLLAQCRPAGRGQRQCCCSIGCSWRRR